MIKGTTADCKIKSITVTDSTAAISCILYSLSPAVEHKAFKFYLRDKNSKHNLIPLSENIYWIDRINNYNNDILNVDVNQYKEILFYVDITNLNSGTIIENKWVRECNIILRNIKEPSTNYAWVSEDLTLVSKAFEIPSIKELDIYSDNQYNLYINYYYHYLSQADFTYNNNNLYTTINIISPFTDNVLESLDISRDDIVNNQVKCQLLNSYNSLIKIQIQLKNTKGEILYTLEKLYTPIIRKTSTFIKTTKGVERALAYYIKDNKITNDIAVAISNPTRLRSSRVVSKAQPQEQKEIPSLKINFNNAIIKTPSIQEPIAYCIGDKTLTIKNPNTSVFTNCRLSIYLDDTYIGETTNNLYTQLFEPGYFNTPRTLKVEIEGMISALRKVKTFSTTVKSSTVCSNNLTCSDKIFCSDSTGGN